MSLNSRNAHQIGVEQIHLAAMVKLLRSLKKIVQGRSQASTVSKDLIQAGAVHGKNLLLIVAAVCLASRALLPKRLVGTKLSGFIKECAEALGKPALVTDETEFCDDIVKSLIGKTDVDSLIRGTSAELIKVFLQFRLEVALENPLALGWFQQCLIKETPRSVELNDGHIMRAKLNDVAQLTQWFTPEWIAHFLVEQSIENNPTATFIDPACGAGHLLLPALKRLLSMADDGINAESLRIILENQLYGIDIDENLVNLGKFSIYLFSRDAAGICELPPPQILTIEDKWGAGSLLLGLSNSNYRNVNNNIHIPSRFDAVAMNPPYLGHRTMPQTVRNFLREEYSNSQYDLFAAFLELGMRLTKPEGRLSAICQQSVLTIQRYNELRSQMLQQTDIESVVQLGSGTFATKGGEKTNNAIVTLRKHPDSEKSMSESPVRCWRILEKKEKMHAQQSGIENFPHKIIQRAEAIELAKKLPESPFSFWAPVDVVKLFEAYPRFDDPETGITCTNGLFTCNNKKFVKHFTEIPAENQHEYVPYDKGGGYKWFRTSDLMLHWKGDGEEIRNYRIKRGQSAKLPGEAHYFKCGVTYSYIGTRGFKARLLTPNSIFDVASSAIFSEKTNVLYILGLLNSSLTRCILGTLNPTINFQIGDIRKIPFAAPDSDIEGAVSALVDQAISIAKQLETFDESSPRYDNKNADAASYQNHLMHWTNEESKIQTALDEIFFDHYSIGKQSRAQILSDPWVTRASNPFAKR